MSDAATESALLPPGLLSRLDRLALVARKKHRGGAAGERRSKRRGQSVEFADYRDYVQGDDTRHLDWNLFARLEHLYLKLFEEQEELTLNVLVDGSQSMAFGTPAKADFARRLAAALGYIALVGYDRAHVEWWSEGGASLGPLQGKAQARKLFAFLEAAACGGSTDLESAARRFALRPAARGIVVLISDLFDERGPDAALRRLQQLRAETYVVQVLAPEEIAPDLSGDLKLVDSETGAHAEISVTPALLRRYEQNRDAFIEQTRQACVRRGAQHVVVASDTPMERLTLDILRRGGLLRT